MVTVWWPSVELTHYSFSQPQATITAETYYKIDETHIQLMTKQFYICSTYSMNNHLFQTFVGLLTKFINL